MAPAPKYVINPYTRKLDQTVGVGDETTFVSNAYFSNTGAGGGVSMFISNTQPTTSQTKYLWIQTGLGDDGTDCTFWIEDGT